MLDRDIEAMAARAEASAKRKVEAVRRWFDRIRWRKRVHESYRAIFLQDGAMRTEATDVIADLSAWAGMGVAESAKASEAELRDSAARRSAVLHVISRLDLDGGQLKALAEKLRKGPEL